MTTNEKTVGKGRNFVLGAAGALMLAAFGCADVDGAATGDQGVTQPGAGVIAAGAADAVVPPMMSAEDEAKLRLRASIEFPGQGVVKFFEPQDGVVLISEHGINGTPAMIPSTMDKMSASQLYEALANKPAPSALLEATARAGLLKSRPARTLAPVVDLAPNVVQKPAATADVGGGVTQVKSALTFSSYDQWFYDNFCAGGKRVGTGWDYVVSWMFVTGTGSFTRYDQNWVDSTVSVYAGGSVHYKVQIMPWYTWSTAVDVTIQNGYYNKFHRENGTDYDVYIYVDQAAGDSYHWCSYGDSW